MSSMMFIQVEWKMISTEDYLKQKEQKKNKSSKVITEDKPSKTTKRK